MPHSTNSAGEHAAHPLTISGRAAAWWRLTRPPVVAMVLLTLIAGASLDGSPAWGAVLHALIGTAAVIVGAVAANQWVERTGDALMPRTAVRPLPTRRLSAAQVARLSALGTLGGLAYLMVFAGGIVTAIAAVSWLLYVTVYTPLKYRSTWQTPVGAAAGAMPVIIGAAAGDGTIGPAAWALFGAVFLWQIPHATAIGWIYRRQFAEAGVRLPVVVEPTGRAGGAVAVIAAALLPLCAVGLHEASPGYVSPTVVAALGLVQLAAAARFARRRTDARARQLLWASMIYLPVMLLTLLAA